MMELPRVVQQDSYLLPVVDEILRRAETYKLALTDICGGDVVEFANGYTYYGFQRDELRGGWWFREWLPLARRVYIFGDFNNWDRMSIPLKKLDGGVWEIFLADADFSTPIVNGTQYKLFIQGNNGWNERIDAYARRAVQNEVTKDFVAEVESRSFDWGKTSNLFHPQPLIYESHVGMSSELEEVASFDYFRENILPEIKQKGYNTVQFMAIAEHPYYGSFGYHVSNFFAVSSRFGTTNDFKELVKAAHSMGLAVVIDLVHSHYVKNINEGLNVLDGSECHYCKLGDEGYNKYWDSKNFDYLKPQVLHFLLSNIKYWVEEYKVDGFRFDGVTAMLYKNHGYQKFVKLEDYFGDNINEAALCYLTLANRLIHTLNPSISTIAEDVSGMPTLCSTIEDGGAGFDYRLTMSVPDYWIELLEQRDEDWDLSKLWGELNNRTTYTKAIGYCESHDQAMVGDKTLAFRLMDSAMYSDMDKSSESLVVERGVALHKIIRLLTISTAANGYLNFMGNEFGHPQWIDFPRLGNNWSYLHARREWSLSKNPFLRYSQLMAFDKAMIDIVSRFELLDGGYGYIHTIDQENKIIAFSRGKLLFVFNLHPTNSIADYPVVLDKGASYRLILDSDSREFGGTGRQDCQGEIFTQYIDNQNIFKLYATSRTALVFEIV